MHWFILALIGLIGGLLSGMFGIGGGIDMVPCLVLLVGLLAALGAWKYYQAGHVDLTNFAPSPSSSANMASGLPPWKCARSSEVSASSSSEPTFASKVTSRRPSAKLAG